MNMPIGTFNEGTLRLSEPSQTWINIMLNKNIQELKKEYAKAYKVYVRLKSGHTYLNRMAWILSRIHYIRSTQL